jgi:hypothetical protein
VLHPSYERCQEKLDQQESDIPGISPRGPPAVSPLVPDDTVPASHPILGNRKSMIYHRPDCPNYGEIAMRNRVPFINAAEAKAAGYRQAKNCP